MRNLSNHSRWSHRASVALLAAGFWVSPAAAESLLLKNATVHVVSGPVLSPGDVLIENGKITRVGHIDAGADKVLDLTGQHLYPGMIALNTALGLMEIESVRATMDFHEIGQFVPEVHSWVAVNPDSELLGVTRANGVTYFEPVPKGDGIAGQSALMAIDGWTTEDMIFKKPVGLHVYWPEMELRTMPGRGRRRGGAPPNSVDEQAKGRERKIKDLSEYFADARAYADARAAAQTKGGPAVSLNPSWEAMIPYVTGKSPVVIHAGELRQIKSAVKWAQTNHFNIIIAGGRDAWEVAGLLATNNIPVIYDSVYALPASEIEPYDVHYKAPGVLRAAGVKVAISEGGAASLTKNLPYDAAQAAAYGLPEDEALKAITLYPAQIIGVDDRLGSIEPGKDATVFACSGDILDIRANVTHLWMAGHEVSLESRHTRLYEKYKNRPPPKQ